MGRTKEYDRDEAIEKAMMLFWAQGYTATSVQQLLDVMNMSRSSMYSEFGNKRDLFLETLSFYRSLSTELINSISTATDPVQAIKGFYEVGFSRQSNKQLYQGCLLVNTILELRDVDNELSSIAGKYFDEIENKLALCFETCIANGTLEHGYDPERLANFFMTTIKGMRVVARQKPGDDYLRGVMETALLVFNRKS